MAIAKQKKKSLFQLQRKWKNEKKKIYGIQKHKKGLVITDAVQSLIHQRNAKKSHHQLKHLKKVMWQSVKNHQQGHTLSE